jgi:bacterioferritin-associated ferredoxin
MQKRKAGQGLKSTGFTAGGKHRSHVSGVRRFVAGKNKSYIEDTLNQNAKQLARRMGVGAVCPKCDKRILTEEESRTLTVNLKTICVCKVFSQTSTQRQDSK